MISGMLFIRMVSVVILSVAAPNVVAFFLLNVAILI
jgi:hypothetical protein